MRPLAFPLTCNVPLSSAHRGVRTRGIRPLSPHRDKVLQRGRLREDSQVVGPCYVRGRSGVAEQVQRATNLNALGLLLLWHCRIVSRAAILSQEVWFSRSVLCFGKYTRCRQASRHGCALHQHAGKINPHRSHHAHRNDSGCKGLVVRSTNRNAMKYKGHSQSCVACTAASIVFSRELQSRESFALCTNTNSNFAESALIHRSPIKYAGRHFAQIFAA